VLKCDIKKFFASIDHEILKNILIQYIDDQDVIWLLGQVIDSFKTNLSKGLPLGNLTSQLLVNIYMNEFDHFIKHKIKAKYYVRYADDFVILSENKKWLEIILLQIDEFLWEKLKLKLHPNKIFINTLVSGIDFLGWVHFPDHRVLRATSKRRMLRNIEVKNYENATLQSYLGLLKHGNARKLYKAISEID
jgi:retron-type reverse transcriptase